MRWRARTEYWRALLGRAHPAHRARVSDGHRRRVRAFAAPEGGTVTQVVLQVSRLAKAFGGVRAVDDVSFAVAAGELVALIGPNGAGKTTCFNLVNGQLAPDAGSVQLAGARIDGLARACDRAARRRPHVPGRRHVRVDDGARKRPAGAARACRTHRAPAAPSHRRGRRRGRRAARARRLRRPGRCALRGAGLRRRQARGTGAGAGGRRRACS